MVCLVGDLGGRTILVVLEGLSLGDEGDGDGEAGRG